VLTFPQKLVYKYSLQTEAGIIWEREPSRYLEILDPSASKAERQQEWRNSDRGFLVNGLIRKVDANFVGGMTFDKIGDTQIYLGPYP